MKKDHGFCKTISQIYLPSAETLRADLAFTVDIFQGEVRCHRRSRLHSEVETMPQVL